MSNYYRIDETAAARAKAANSFSDYRSGSQTASYQHQVDAAVKLGEEQKKRVDPMYHEKIDRLVDTYARRLAENINKGNSIAASCPSILISGAGNFPVRKKMKQNARADANMQEYNEIQGLLDKIRGVGMGGIQSSDPNALEKLRAKLEGLEALQERMRSANSAIRMKDTEKGNAKLRELGFTDKQIAELREPDFCGRVGYPSYALSNNNANIHRIRERVAALEKEASTAASEDVTGDGFTLHENKELGRIQFLFEGKPDADTRDLLKKWGFRWAPSQSAWQRQLNDNGRHAAKRVMEAMSHAK